MSKQTDLINIPDAITVSGSNVGICTSSPSQKLTISGGTSDVAMLWNSTDTAYHNFGILKNGSLIQMGEYNNAGDTLAESILNIEMNGDKVGIGTSSPSEKLHVQGDGADILLTDSGGGQTAKLGATGSNNGLLELNNSSHTPKVFLNTSGDSYFNGGNVGIGTSSPSELLSVYHATNSRVLISTGVNGASQIYFGDNGNDLAGRIYYDHNANSMRFHVNTNERFRIDSSGNLLVGKTSVDSGVVGVEAKANGTLVATVDGDTVSLLNRKTSDGEILRLQKDGTTVGSIMSRGGAVSTLILDPRSNGAGLSGTTNGILPTTQTGSPANNHVDLGTSSSNFRNAYLSGGIYLGGTGSANKLEDYEEGTWNPVVTGSSTAGTMNITDRRGRYTKVGRLVTLHFYFDGDSGNGSGNLLLGGVPFTIANHHFAFGSPQWNTGISYPSGGIDANWLRYNSTSFDIRCNMNNAGFTTIAYSSNVEYLRGCITYETDQ